MKAPRIGPGSLALATVLFASSALLTLAAPMVAAQTVSSSSSALPKIVISPLDTPAGDQAARGIAGAVSQSLALMLHLTKAFTIVNADFLDPNVAYHRSVLYYQQVGARIGIFGAVSSSPSGVYTVTLEYWRASASSSPPRKFTTSFTNIFAVFSAADRLALNVASAAAGRTLTVGTVAIEKTGGLAKYSIYADGVLVARNRSRVQVLTGQRTIIVAVPGPLGDEPVQTFHIDVKAGQSVTLALNETAAAGKTTGGQVGQAPKLTAAKRPPAPPKGGALSIRTSPEGATVLLDGTRVGTTPLDLRSISAGAHSLNIARQYFLAAHRTVNVSAGGKLAVNVQLELDKTDPALQRRIINPLGTLGASLLWSAVQAGSLASIGLASSGTSSFWAVRPFPLSIYLGQILFLDSNVYLARIGNRLARNSLLTGIGDAAGAAGAAMVTTDFYPIWSNPITASLGYGLPLTGGFLTTVSVITLGADALYDAVSAPFASVHTNAELLQYVKEHGTLPPLEVRRPHRLIIATGGESFVRAGYQMPIIPRYLSLEATGGVGAASLSPFSLAVSANADVSYDPWGAKTGNLRPELFVGLRGSTNFSSVSVAPEFGTGNDWIGRNFDIFTRGGVDFDLVGHHWDQFFTVGTRIY